MNKPTVTVPPSAYPTVEDEIQAKGLTAPRITPADLAANIASEHYFTAGQGATFGAIDVAGTPNEGCPPSALNLLTFCVLVLKNGFTVTGESACASPENFDPEIGRRIARDNAIQKVWPLMGYELRSRLHEREQFLAGTRCSPEPEACPHADPFNYCPQCVADPCPIGLGNGGAGQAGE